MWLCEISRSTLTDLVTCLASYSQQPTVGETVYCGCQGTVHSQIPETSFQTYIEQIFVITVVVFAIGMLCFPMHYFIVERLIAVV